MVGIGFGAQTPIQSAYFHRNFEMRMKFEAAKVYLTPSDFLEYDLF